MFFASQDTMKSVVAAEVAALCGWRVLKEMVTRRLRFSLTPKAISH